LSKEILMAFFQSRATARHLHGLTVGLLIAGLVAGCHFEARIGSGDDAKAKKSKTEPAKSKDADKPDGKKSNSKKSDDKKDEAKDDKKDEPAKADAKDKEKKDEPAAAVPAKDAATLPGNLVFEAGKSSLKAGPGTEEVLASLKTYLDQQPRVTLLRLEGHSDNAASPADNLRISGERALAVKQWLIGKGIAESRLVAVGFGEKKPIVDNATEEGRAQNRRVEFKIAKINGKPYLGNDPLGGGTEFK
jgi:outer membrane protein OmpA-like peptidoglycan-associated protein